MSLIWGRTLKGLIWVVHQSTFDLHFWLCTNVPDLSLTHVRNLMWTPMCLICSFPPIALGEIVSLLRVRVQRMWQGSLVMPLSSLKACLLQQSSPADVTTNNHTEVLSHNFSNHRLRTASSDIIAEAACHPSRKSLETTGLPFSPRSGPALVSRR